VLGIHLPKKEQLLKAMQQDGPRQGRKLYDRAVKSGNGKGREPKEKEKPYCPKGEKELANRTKNKKKEWSKKGRTNA